MQTKKYLLGVLALFIAITISSSLKAQISKVKIQATGLTCSMCSNAINNELKAIAGVENVETDLNTNTFIVSLKKENKLTPFIFKQKVEDAGFFVGSLIITLRKSAVAKEPYVLLDQSVSAATSQFQVMDKGYVTDKAYKKIAKAYSENKSYTGSNDHIFHLKAIN